MRLRGKVALVTGGASGIGAASCELMACEGASIAIADINDTAGQTLALKLQEEGADARFYHLDVTCEEQWAQVVKSVTDDFGGLHILVNGAAMVERASIEDITLDLWDKIVLVNQTSVLLGTREGVRWMKEHGGGSIINMSSIAGKAAQGRDVGYNATKAAVGLMSKSAALHCAEHNYNIRVNTVHPGYTSTPLIEEGYAKMPSEYRQARVDMIPLGRFADADEIAQGIIYLASDESKYVTASELVIDGGFLA